MQYNTKTYSWHELWLTVAEAFLTPRISRTDLQNNITGLGLCYSYLALNNSNPHIPNQNFNIGSFLCKFTKDSNSHPYFGGFTPIMDKHRGNFALLLAELTPEDIYELFIYE